jgi:Flp pilus assembly CpaE family ATPase
VIAVAGARGGIGATTISAIMARALDDAVLIDLDVVSAGQRAFCAEEPARTLGSLRSSLADLSPDALLAALSPERVLHGDPGDAPLSAAECNGVVRAARALGGPVVLDCGRANDPAARAVAANADVRALVVSDDVASVRAMRPFLDLGPCALVIRRARRDGVSIRDIEAAAGTEARVVVRVERALSRAADLGELPQRPTRAMRALTRLAHELVEARA